MTEGAAVIDSNMFISASILLATYVLIFSDARNVTEKGYKVVLIGTAN